MNTRHHVTLEQEGEAAKHLALEQRQTDQIGAEYRRHHFVTGQGWALLAFVLTPIVSGAMPEPKRKAA